MKPASITGSAYCGAIHQDSNFEAGMHFSRHQMWLYCAWREGNRLGIVWEAESWDELLLKVAKKNSDAAKWLLSKRLNLCNPRETILELTLPRVVNAWICDPDDIGGTAIELVGGTGASELAEILEFYGWSRTDTHPEFYWFDEKR